LHDELGAISILFLLVCIYPLTLVSRPRQLTHSTPSFSTTAFLAPLTVKKGLSVSFRRQAVNCRQNYYSRIVFPENVTHGKETIREMCSGKRLVRENNHLGKLLSG